MSLKFGILALISQRAQTGYELKDSFDGSVGYFWNAKFQQVYQELGRLEREGLVVAEAVPQAGRPTKKVYSITPAGEAALAAWLDKPPAAYATRDELLLKLFCYQHMSPQRALEQLEAYQRRHEERLAQYRTIESRFREAGWVSDEHVDEACVGSYLTLRRGILHQESVIEWCRWAASLIRRLEKAAPRSGGRRLP